MNWQQLSVVSCILWGVVGILLARSTQTQAGLAVTICYSGGVFGTALALGLIRRQPIDFGQGMLYIAIAAGFCSAIAIFAQMTALHKSPTEYPWIFLVGSLNPIVTIIFALCCGARPTGRQWLGMLCAFIGLVLISWPSQKETGPATTHSTVSIKTARP